MFLVFYICSSDGLVFTRHAGHSQAISRPQKIFSLFLKDLPFSYVLIDVAPEVFSIPGHSNQTNNKKHQKKNKTMPDDNRISVALSDADKQAILDAVAVIKSKLPFLLNLTPDDRINLPKMSDKSVAFDEKCATYMDSLPTLVPGFVNVAEVKKDRDLRNQLAGVAAEIAALAASMDDTMMVVSSELWMADLSFYQSIRQGAKRSVAGAQGAYDDLSQRFPGANPKPAAKTAKTT